MKRLMFLMAALIPGIASAQQGEYPGFFETYFIESVLTLAASVCIVALIVLIVTFNAIRTLLNAQKPAEEVQAKVEEPSIFQKWWDSVNDLKPMQREVDILTDHEYDGIRELDNNLPPWWKWMFYLSIVFGVVYLVHFHVLNTGMSSGEEYAYEMDEAAREVAEYKALLASTQGDVEVPTEGPEAIAAGKSTYIKFCAACHGNGGQGGVGPNFADQYWIHGGSLEDIVATIEDGVPAKGMISWKSQLSPAEIKQVAAFIITLEGTNPPNPKDPQGELYEREDLQVGEPMAINN